MQAKKRFTALYESTFRHVWGCNNSLATEFESRFTVQFQSRTTRWQLFPLARSLLTGCCIVVLIWVGNFKIPFTLMLRSSTNFSLQLSTTFGHLPWITRQKSPLWGCIQGHLRQIKITQYVLNLMLRHFKAYNWKAFFFLSLLDTAESLTQGRSLLAWRPLSSLWINKNFNRIKKRIIRISIKNCGPPHHIHCFTNRKHQTGHKWDFFFVLHLSRCQCLQH